MEYLSYDWLSKYNKTSHMLSKVGFSKGQIMFALYANPAKIQMTP